MKVTRIETGKYRAEANGKTYLIQKSRLSGRWQTLFDDGKIYSSRTKKDMVNWLSHKNEVETPNTKGGTFKFTQGNHGVLAEMGVDKNHCFPIAVARALATDPKDVSEVAPLAKEISNEWYDKGLTRDGRAYYDSCIAPVLCKFGFDKDSRRGRVKTGTGSINSRRETVAQFLKRHPDVKEAIFMTTGHASYYKEGHAFSLGSRMRVWEVYVLATKK